MSWDVVVSCMATKAPEHYPHEDGREALEFVRGVTNEQWSVHPGYLVTSRHKDPYEPRSIGMPQGFWNGFDHCSNGPMKLQERYLLPTRCVVRKTSMVLHCGWKGDKEIRVIATSIESWEIFEEEHDLIRCWATCQSLSEPAGLDDDLCGCQVLDVLATGFFVEDSFHIDKHLKDCWDRSYI